MSDGADYRQQQEQDEQYGVLWYALQQLRGHISDETFKQVEHELGMD